MPTDEKTLNEEDRVALEKARRLGYLATAPDFDAGIGDPLFDLFLNECHGKGAPFITIDTGWTTNEPEDAYARARELGWEDEGEPRWDSRSARASLLPLSDHSSIFVHLPDGNTWDDTAEYTIHALVEEFVPGIAECDCEVCHDECGPHLEIYLDRAIAETLAFRLTELLPELIVPRD